MKSSVYKLSHGVFVAELAGRQVMRGSIDDLAAALTQAGLTVDDLLLGDWCPDAELLTSAEQLELRQGMLAGLAAADHAITPQTTTMAPDLTG
jgi:hypothetical protein